MNQQRIIDRESLIDGAMTDLKTLVRLLKNGRQEGRSAHFLSGPQMLVLKNIALKGPLSLSQLSKSLHVTPSNITGIVDRLEKKDLVKRGSKPGDRRVYLIHLTDTGTEVARSLPVGIEEKLAGVLGTIDEASLEQFAGVLKQLLLLIEPLNSR